MGYSIFTIAKDKETAKRMFDFMSSNMKSFNLLMGKLNALINFGLLRKIGIVISGLGKVLILRQNSRNIISFTA